MALALTAASPARRSLAALVPSFALPLLRPSAAASGSLQLDQMSQGLSIWQALQDLLPSIVWAVPKKQTSKRAKRLQNFHKNLKPRQDINHCKACGLPKLHGHICWSCLSSIRREVKNASRVSQWLALKEQGLDAPVELPSPRPKNYLETGNPPSAEVEQAKKDAARRTENKAARVAAALAEAQAAAPDAGSS